VAQTDVCQGDDRFADDHPRKPAGILKKFVTAKNRHDREIDMSEGATASDSPFIKGRNARLYGKQRESCPYAEGSPDHAAWIEAYDEAGDDRMETGTVDPQAAPKT
jgi:ribosome modulation factor